MIDIKAELVKLKLQQANMKNESEREAEREIRYNIEVQMTKDRVRMDNAHKTNIRIHEVQKVIIDVMFEMRKIILSQNVIIRKRNVELGLDPEKDTIGMVETLNPILYKLDTPFEEIRAMFD